MASIAADDALILPQRESGRIGFSGATGQARGVSRLSLHFLCAEIESFRQRLNEGDAVLILIVGLGESGDDLAAALRLIG
jgi:hypothetical protein